MVTGMETNTYSKEEEEEEKNADVHLLHEMGYLQELYRGFSPLMSFTFCFTAVNVLSSISVGFNFTLNTGGSAVAVYSWLIGSIFTMFVGLSLAEICSIYPSAGSVYHWAGQLVSPQRAPLASFICGWFNFIGNFAGDVALASGFAKLINSALIISNKPSLSNETQVAIGIGILFLWCLQNALRVDQNGWLNNIAALVQVASSIIVILVLYTASGQRATVHDVFTSTYNETGFPFIYVCCISLLSTLFSFSGYEGGAHMAEETRGASVAAPRGIVATCLCSAIVGAIYLLALLFAIPNVETFMKRYGEKSDTMNLAVIVYQTVVPGYGALVLTILLIMNLYVGGMASVTVTSRIGFAMARDGVFPFSSYLRWIYQGTKTPLGSILFVFVIDSSLLLMQLVSASLFTNFIAIGTIGLQVSYLLPIVFRCTSARKTFPLGEFNIGRFSLPVAIISSIWLTITSIFMFFPIHYPITTDNMNYSIVVFISVSILAGNYWLISARHWFVGPPRAEHNTPLIPLGEMSSGNKFIKESLSDKIFQ
ncbi:hypothetical protein I4U23_008840 [Adineta vaga]|nr:hypothetical protein I4U23_008840 [Adineta vaga]